MTWSTMVHAPAFAAARVAVDDVVAVIRPVLHLVIEHGTVDGLGTAVNIEDDGALFARFEAHRL